VDAAEVARFSAAAPQWWRADGPFAGLHALNAVRVPLILRAAAAVRASASAAATAPPPPPPPSALPLSGLSLLDIGSGGGLLSEALARLGGDVTGADASPAAVAAARAHAAQDPRLARRLRYVEGSADAPPLAGGGRRFDVVVASEVLEHVRAPAAFVAAAAALVAPRGALVLTTINRSAAAFALAVLAAEYVARLVPPGTHDWAKFVTPDEARAMLAAAGLTAVEACGLAFNPLSGRWSVAESMAVNYAIVARKGAEN